MLTATNIAIALRNLGLQAGDTVLVHSSLSSFGEVEGGAGAVVDAILQVVGPSGTLVVPTFNYTPGLFDPTATPSVCGAITEAARQRPNALRSSHPTHSVAAIGPLAEVITEDQEDKNAFGRGSSLYRLLQAKGKILLLGVSHTASSIIHVAEEMANLPYLDRSRQIEFRNRQGKISHKWIRRPGCSVGFDAIEEPLQEQDAIAETFIGECRARLMTSRDVVNAAVEMLKSDAEALLCERPDCSACAEARAMITAREMEKQDQEVIELAAEEDRTLRLIESRFGTGKVDFFTSESGEGPTPN